MHKHFSFGQKGSSITYKANVMASINWVIGFLEFIFMSGLVFGPTLWIQIFSGVLICLSLAFYLSMYLFFAISDRDRLQSERFQIDKFMINALYESKGSIDADKISFTPSDTPTIQPPPSDLKNINR